MSEWYSYLFDVFYVNFFFFWGGFNYWKGFFYFVICLEICCFIIFCLEINSGGFYIFDYWGFELAFSYFLLCIEGDVYEVIDGE